MNWLLRRLFRRADRGGRAVAGPVTDLPQRPTVGRIVWYRPRTGAYTVPAIITATIDTLDAAAVEAGIIPGVANWLHVHLTVFSPGVPEVGPNRPSMKAEVAARRSLPPGATSFNLAGTYQEWDVPFFHPGGSPVSCDPAHPMIPDAGVDDGELGPVEQAPGSWTWPERA